MLTGQKDKKCKNICLPAFNYPSCNGAASARSSGGWNSVVQTSQYRCAPVTMQTDVGFSAQFVRLDILTYASYYFRLYLLLDTFFVTSRERTRQWVVKMVEKLW
jgi:hypothetical protein